MLSVLVWIHVGQQSRFDDTDHTTLISLRQLLIVTHRFVIRRENLAFAPDPPSPAGPSREGRKEVRKRLFEMVFRTKTRNVVWAVQRMIRSGKTHSRITSMTLLQAGWRRTLRCPFRGQCPDIVFAGAVGFREEDVDVGQGRVHIDNSFVQVHAGNLAGQGDGEDVTLVDEGEVAEGKAGDAPDVAERVIKRRYRPLPEVKVWMLNCIVIRKRQAWPRTKVCDHFCERKPDIFVPWLTARNKGKWKGVHMLARVEGRSAQKGLKSFCAPGCHGRMGCCGGTRHDLHQFVWGQHLDKEGASWRRVRDAAAEDHQEPEPELETLLGEEGDETDVPEEVLQAVGSGACVGESRL